ncbi:type VI secretion system protein ImpG [Duganella sp. CF517]|uniref:type VI secretion system baseplate subunit TssF n=1 Tax=Duganella sp. CF517 TaxID=1881038 RepID=UPI0008C494C3|nr:type VI secretion system baseplate subunit TssF [Duganella sp. CF517]SEO57966.1 type VI secretion system protein ImpG [Duganella sp. CF517]
MDKLLPYVERELGLLRQGGAEFAGRYPKLAGSLKADIADFADGGGGADPHVERLIQGSAVLNARVGKLLDDGYAGFAEALLGMLYPHYLRPVPACSIAHIDHGGRTGGGVTRVPRGTAMTALGPAKVACRFRTVYDVAVAPVAISAAWFEPHIAAPPGLPLPGEADAAVCITLDSLDGALGPALDGLSTLRVFIDGEPSLRAALRDTLFMRAAGACVEAGGQWRVLSAPPIAPVGFGDGEALLPAAASEHGGYRLLGEYFAFAEKFDFFDIDLDAVLADVPAGCVRLTLRLALAGCRPDMPAARILRALVADNLVLGCTPIVNLYAQPATPIRITHARSSYPLMPDQLPGGGSEIYSVDSVHLVRPAADGDDVTEFFPYYSLRHGGAASRKGRYWLASRDEALAAAGAGHDVSLTLVDHDFSPWRNERATASVRLTCTNRDLPHYMEYGRPRGDLATQAAVGGLPIRVLRRPTTSYRLSANGNVQWGLISHLALNHRALTRQGLPALTAMLRLYARRDNAVSQRQIDGVSGLSHRPATKLVRQARGSAYLRGTEVTVALDEEAFAGTGLHLFAQLLDHLFGLHVHLNSYTQLVVVSSINGKELLRCLPRNGTLSLA